MGKTAVHMWSIVIVAGITECHVGVSVAAVRQHADERRRHVALQSRR